MISFSTLPNGLRVLTDEMPHIHSIHLGVWVNVGGRYEALPQHGISHLLEHMAFKGTQTRSALDIAEQIENVGAMMNAYTGREQTAYYVRALKQDAALCTEIIGDILQNSIFDVAELVREKSVILQEIGEADDNPDDVLFDVLQEACYPDQSLGRSILGTKDSVMAQTAEDLKYFIHKHYVPQNMIFAASGAITHQEMLDYAGKYLDFPSSSYVFETEALKWQGGILHTERSLEQFHMAFCVQGCSYFDPDYYCSEIFSTLFGGGMSSRLFQEIREKQGLAYHISSFTSNYMDGGNFGIYAGCDPEKANVVLELSLQEMKKITDFVSDDELSRAKAQMRAGLLMALESPSGRTEPFVRQQFIFNRFISTEEMIAEIDAVTKQDIRAFANRLLMAPQKSFASIGKKTAGHKIEKLLV